MKTKGKISLTIDYDLLSEIEKASRAYNIAKSQLVQEALKLWLQSEVEKLMAKGYEDMAQQDKKNAEIFFEAQREIIE
jgi:metal-responsive CopG/Arc/MetJ family transcriptional regulator